MNTLGKCPIRIAIDDIRVGGRGNDDPETSTAPTMRIRGAGADDLTYVIDDVQYFLNARSIAIARAKLHKRDLRKLAAMLFTHHDTRREIYDYLLSKSGAPGFALRQLERLLSLVSDVNSVILERASTASALHVQFRKRQYGMESQLDLTLPSLPPNMEAASAASTAMTPDTMIAIANAAIDVLNRTDATALGIRKLTVAPFTTSAPAPYVDDTAVAASAEIDRMHGIELEISSHVHKYEIFLAAFVNHLAVVFDDVATALKR